MIGYGGGPHRPGYTHLAEVGGEGVQALLVAYGSIRRKHTCKLPLAQTLETEEPVGFSTAVTTAFAQYASFRGRASRPAFWWFFLFFGLVSIGGLFLTYLMGSVAIYYVLMLPLILPFLAVAVRRLHDTGRSGWWYLLLVVPVAGIAVYVFWALSGQRGPNRFGPAPV